MPSSGILGQTADLAADIVDDVRTSLMCALRFMDVALWRMPVAARRLSRATGTDGYLYYVDPLSLVMAYKGDANEVVRDYLHAIMHCVFRHPFDSKHPDRELWDLSCDIAVESCALEIVGLRYPSSLDAERKQALDILRQACPRLTAGKLYNVLAVALDKPSENAGTPLPVSMTAHFIASLPALFVRDDHGVWTRSKPEPIVSWRMRRAGWSWR